jgi:hypothetical protein
MGGTAMAVGGAVTGAVQIGRGFYHTPGTLLILGIICVRNLYIYEYMNIYINMLVCVCKYICVCAYRSVVDSIIHQVLSRGHMQIYLYSYCM